MVATEKEVLAVVVAPSGVGMTSAKLIELGKLMLAVGVEIDERGVVVETSVAATSGLIKVGIRKNVASSKTNEPQLIEPT